MIILVDDDDDDDGDSITKIHIPNVTWICAQNPFHSD
jgi:hypothetical protein